jgi:hypothetical protein
VRPNGTNRISTAPAVGGLFFPQSKSLGIDLGEYSPAVLDRITFAGANNTSYAQASLAMSKLADLPVGAKQIERVIKRIGGERCQERDEAVAAFQALPLAQRKQASADLDDPALLVYAPTPVAAPALAVVGADGGRLQILERGAAAAASVEPDDDTSEDERKGHWREDKIGLLMTMDSEESATDPCPELPEHFKDPTRMAKLVRELKAKKSATQEALDESPEPEKGAEALDDNGYHWQPPKVRTRDLVASRCRWGDFAIKLAMMAWSQGFFGARRQAFLGDGSDNNWAIHRRYFSSFVPILDIIHVLSYVYAAALAGRSFKEGWPIYSQWMTWVWQGKVAQVIAALAVRQAELGVPDKDEGTTTPRSIVARALGYLQNHKDKMRYPEYRRLGLPITSSYVESAVKQINLRVKGTEKFWAEAGAEPMLHLRADYLSAGEPLTGFWDRRQARQTGQYQTNLAA